jgi:hypothetical protein
MTEGAATREDDGAFVARVQFRAARISPAAPLRVRVPLGLADVARREPSARKSPAALA